MEFVKRIYNICNDHAFLLLFLFVALSAILWCLLIKQHDKVGLSEDAGTFIALISLVILLILYVIFYSISLGYENSADKAITNSQKAGYVSTKYVLVKPYKVQSYLPTGKNKAQVLLNNSKVEKNVSIKQITEISSKNNNTSLFFYDMNLKEKYQPTNKDRFRKKILVIVKHRIGISDANLEKNIAEALIKEK